MIIWLASYPKSGNTLLRSMLSAYFFTKDGKFNFDTIKNINQFPDLKLFKNYGVNTSDQIEIVRNYINVQNKINESKTIQNVLTKISIYEYLKKFKKS